MLAIIDALAAFCAEQPGFASLLQSGLNQISTDSVAKISANSVAHFSTVSVVKHSADSVAIATGSQVCNLSWSKNVNEIVSTHGYSQNQIIVWKHPTMTKLATLTGHTLRVLYLAVSPDGQTIVTGAGESS